LQLIGPFNINYYYRHRLRRVVVIVVVVKPAPKDVRPRVTRGASPFSESTTGLQAARLNPDEGTVAAAAGSQRCERRYTTYTVGAALPSVAWQAKIEREQPFVTIVSCDSVSGNDGEHPYSVIIAAV